MPKFGKTSTARLQSCHPDLQAIFTVVIQSLDCSIFCGHRNKADQQQAFNASLSQVQFPNSKHNSMPSMATDAGPYFTELKNTDWEDIKAFATFAGYVKRVSHELLAQGVITHHIRWGGDWDGDGRTSDQTFHDLPHFELIKVN
ncbi:peptidase [Shewanella hanedai]|uniref:M15 family metallopeptidase n=1 Tax=Shewanella hanedai TaxID=25 RepID=A0A553JN35_SHEHA|nr:M15 family metallopeptidase [Shewanella hanedai]TRY13831.1 M15 family metallopeptidase [Shewanella hanedai]GGI85660.1 peptidase [Shewanella hanedai]